MNAGLAAAPVAEAVRWSDLNPTLRAGGPVGRAAAAVVAAVPRPFGHGWRQLMHPAAFVPQTGSLQFSASVPGDVTLVADQPLEISAVATGSAPWWQPSRRPG